MLVNYRIIMGLIMTSRLRKMRLVLSLLCCLAGMATVLLITPAAAGGGTRAAASKRGAAPTNNARPPATPTAAAIARGARAMPASTPVAEALRAVRLRPEAADEAAQTLAGLGFWAAVDLQLLMAPETGELLTELRAAGMKIGHPAPWHYFTAVFTDQ